MIAGHVLGCGIEDGSVTIPCPLETRFLIFGTGVRSVSIVSGRIYLVLSDSTMGTNGSKAAEEDESGREQHCVLMVWKMEWEDRMVSEGQRGMMYTFP